MASIILSDKSNFNVFKSYWNSALLYQKSNSLPVWPSFPDEIILGEMINGRHYTVCSSDNIIGYFSLTFNDGIIWGELDDGSSIYIHRMVVNPSAKGNKMAKCVLEWALKYAKALNKTYVRMDTWAKNKILIDYYKECGYSFLALKQLGVVSSLPAHYNNLELALFQNCVKSAQQVDAPEPASPARLSLTLGG